MNAINLINFLAVLTIIADASSREDAEDTEAFWWGASVGTRSHLPDGRTLTHL